MAIMLNPYLSFNDCARQALEYYHSFLGGELTLATFGEAGVSNNPAEANKIMHGMITTPEGLVGVWGRIARKFTLRSQRPATRLDRTF